MGVPVHSASGTSDAQVYGSSTVVLGISVRETGDTNPGEVTFRDGIDDTGDVIGFVEVAAGGDAHLDFPEGVYIEAGLFADKGSGDTEIIAYIR